VERKEKRPRDWTAEERFCALIETGQMSDEHIGSWCRSHGLHTHHLKQWRDDAVSGCGNHLKESNRAEQRRLKEQVRSLEKELIRKEKALAETAALRVLRKKANAIWGDGEEG
jgi:transposase-like protein